MRAYHGCYGILPSFDNIKFLCRLVHLSLAFDIDIPAVKYKRKKCVWTDWLIG